MNQPQLDDLTRVKELLRTGQVQEAQRLLGEYLQQKPQSSEAWWLMSFAVSETDRKIYCLVEILKHNPDHKKARQKLDELTGGEQPAGQAAKQRERRPTGKPIVIILFVGLGLILCAGFVYFSTVIFNGLRAESANQEYIVQHAIPPSSTATQTNTPSATPTKTHTPSLTPTESPTRTASPVPTNSPTSTPTATLDPNATRIPPPEDEIGTRPGYYPPDFTLVDAVNGEEITLSNYPDRPMLIVFLRHWCPYCIEEMPAVQALHDKYKDQGLIVLGIGIGANSSIMRSFRSQYGLTFPLMSDWGGNIAKQFDVSGVPTNVIVRKNGKIWLVKVGLMSEAGLNSAIERVMKQP